LININLLPKNLRRRREPGYWRLAAVLLPLVAFSVAAFMQYTVLQTEQNRLEEVDLRQIRLATYQDDLREQQELNARLRQLGELIAIRDAVREGAIVWTSEIAAMLETLPPRITPERPRIAFSQLTLQSLDASARQQRINNYTYEGQDVIAEMSVQGTADSSEALADYIRALQGSPLFGVSFQNAAFEEQTGLYRFSLTVGALAGGRHGRN
jgi:type IV pilus assembly protein PilN